MTEKIVNIKERVSWRGWLFFIPVAIIFSLLLLIIGYFTLPILQESTTKYLVNEINNSIKGEFEYDEIKILGRKIEIDNFIWKGFCNDTIAEVERIEFSLNFGWTTYISKNFHIENLLVKNGYFKQTKYLGDSTNNVSQNFKKGKKNPGQLALILEAPSIVDFCFLIEDENNSSHWKFCTGLMNSDRIVFNNKNKNLKFIGSNSYSMDFGLRFDDLSDFAYVMPPPDPEFTYLTLEFEDVVFCNSHMKFDNNRSEMNFTVDESIDYNHIELENVELELDYFYNHLLDFNANDFRISGLEKSGWNLGAFSAEELNIACESTVVKSLSIQVDSSKITSDISFSYPEGYKSWLDFPNKVKIRNNSKVSFVYPNDLFHLAPGLRNNRFLNQNKNKKFRFSGDIIGFVNSLRFRDFEFNYDDHTFINGQLTLRDVTNGNSFISLRINEMSSEASRIRAAFKDLKLPSSFDNLGRFNFKGTFDGTSSDFITYGKVLTEVGVAKIDLSMRNLSTHKIPEYSGELKLENFDLGLWSGNESFGKFNFIAKLKEGKGLKADNAEAILEADISTLDFNGYTYENISYKGKFSKNQLKGIGSIDDNNIGLSYSGDIEIVDTNYIVDAKLNVENLRMKILNFSKREFSISAQSDLNFRTNSLLDFVGFAKLDSLILKENDKEYFLDEFNVYSLEYGEGQHLNIIGQGFEGRIDGDFKLKNFYKSTINTLYRENMNIADMLNFEYYPEVENEVNNFEIKLRVDSLKGWTKMLLPNLERIDDLDLFVAHKQEYKLIESSLKTPRISLNDVNIDGVNFDMYLEKGIGKINFITDSLVLGKQIIPPIATLFNVSNKSIDFALVSENTNDFIDNVNLTGKVDLLDSIVNISLNEGNLVLFNDMWTILDNNQISIGKNSINAQKFSILNENKSIDLVSTANDRVEIRLSNFDLQHINQFIPLEALKVSGNYDALIEFDNILSLKNINVLGSSKKFEINKDDFGQLQFSASLEDLTSELEGDIIIYKNNQVLQAKFDHNMSENSIHKKHFTNVWMEIKNYPANLLDYFAGETISNTIGHFDSNFKVFGYQKELHIDGSLTIDTFATTVDYLNSRVNFSQQKMILKDSLLECHECKVYDHEGNVAEVIGGIKHSYLTGLEYSVRVVSDNFKVLDTKKGSNQYFYGQAYAGDMDVKVLGPLSNPDLIVNASSNPNSDLIFPLTSEIVSEERNFIVFGKDEAEELQVENLKSGMNLNLNLDVNENAKISIIFDERSNDKITSIGHGNIALTYDETREVGVFGNYDITEGKYLFTYLNVINKPFILREGSNIQFVGSPYDAILGITADYKGLSTPVYPLVQEYISQDNNLENLAKAPTAVDLSMILTGELFSPDIDFGINFPELDRQLKNFADAKISTLQSLENDLNRQVFGLLVVNSFLPSQQGQLQGTQLLTGLNTVSQLISGQVSNYLTGLLGDLILTEDSFLSGFEFDVNASFYNSSNNLGELTNSRELVFNPRFYLLNDRVVVDLSGNYNNSSISNQQNSLSGNFSIGIELTEDRRWLFRAYQRFEPDFDGSDRSKTGVGLSYRTEFNSFKELVQKVNKRHLENMN